VPLAGVLSIGPSRTGLTGFPAPCSPVITSERVWWLAQRGCPRGGLADDQGLASSHGHEVDPRGPLGSAGSVQVGELADVVDLQVLPRLAELAALDQERWISSLRRVLAVQPTVHLDRGYDSSKTREALAERGMTGQIAEKGRPAPIQAGQRWPVERTHAWGNQFKKLVWNTNAATRSSTRSWRLLTRSSR
jgi:hypothetical protein